jgi:hypothetical protein
LTLDVDGHKDVTAWISALEDDFEPLLGGLTEDDGSVSSINAQEHISKTSHQDAGSSLVVVSRPTMEIHDAIIKPAVSASQSILFSKGQPSESAATNVVEAVRTKHLFEDGDLGKIQSDDAYLPVYDDSLVHSDLGLLGNRLWLRDSLQIFVREKEVGSCAI